MKKSNRLIESTSPYLQQHAHNPVDWYPWDTEALTKARTEDKPILVSIGYSACHWCHVMERESFMNPETARIMNEHFVCIKVDREERPDVDQVYMESVQAMGVNGGWPLNVFLLPDQKPFYGGTYFPRDTWNKLLLNISRVFGEQRKELQDSADKITDVISRNDLLKFGIDDEPLPVKEDDLLEIIATISRRFDLDRGGMRNPPKFPMPSIWQFLLHYQALYPSTEIRGQVTLTLDEMAKGGIYDQLGGGFARYSVDGDWLVPHFEKMLYDNGQLLTLYSDAYSATGNGLYKRVVYQTIEWLGREMISDDGGFYSALDADSEGVEGKYYVWSSGEVDKILGEDSSLFKQFYGITDGGNWEGKNILTRKESIEEIAAGNKIKADELGKKLMALDEQMLSNRAERIPPGLDDKILTGWNALIIDGLCHAYTVFKDPEFLNLALKNAEYIAGQSIRDNRLYRSGDIPGYLEDYAIVIQAFLKLYQVTFDEKWLGHSQDLLSYTLEHFYDKSDGFFYFTDANSERLIARKKELLDNVIPGSNSIMAHNLFDSGIITDNAEFRNMASEMLKNVSVLMKTEPSYMSNWARLSLKLLKPFAEVVIVGKGATEAIKGMESQFMPNKLLMGAETSSELPLIRERTGVEELTFFVCYDKSCKLPVQSSDKALSIIKESLNA